MLNSSRLGTQGNAVDLVVGFPGGLPYLTGSPTRTGKLQAEHPIARTHNAEYVIVSLLTRPFKIALPEGLAAQPLVTRYAPSPTGHLHLGHVAHVLFVWGIADALGAKVLLRMEDNDRGRCRPEYEDAILEDLDWLGFRPENSLAENSDYRQSDCDPAYREALDRLPRSQKVYRCTCTRKEIATHSPMGEGGERRYSGHCREKNHPADVSHGLRVVLAEGFETFHDGLLGEQSQDPANQCGDLLLRDRHSQWTYQFTVTADDIRHDVNLVIRGEDLLASTGRQIRLARMLGREMPPLFVHHPLITDDAGDKLSKKQNAPAVREMRRSGVPAAEVLGEAARQVGLTESGHALDAAELSRLFVAKKPSSERK